MITKRRFGVTFLGFRLHGSIDAKDGLRAWLHTSDESYQELGHIQVTVPHSAMTADLTFGGFDGNVSGVAALWPVGVYWHLGWKPSREIIKAVGLKPTEGREIRVTFTLDDESVNHINLHWSLWCPPGEWHSGTPYWRSGAFYPISAIFGKSVFHSRDIGRPLVTVIDLPEGEYPVKVTTSIDTWTRPRWPGNWQQVTRYKVEVMPDEKGKDRGAPVPGKGENSWDCGEDAIYSLTTCARDEFDALQKFRDDVLKTRQKRGGNNWRPEQKPKQRSSADSVLIAVRDVLSVSWEGIVRLAGVR